MCVCVFSLTCSPKSHLLYGQLNLKFHFKSEKILSIESQEGHKDITFLRKHCNNNAIILMAILLIQLVLYIVFPVCVAMAETFDKCIVPFIGLWRQINPFSSCYLINYDSFGHSTLVMSAAKRHVQLINSLISISGVYLIEMDQLSHPIDGHRLQVLFGLHL